MCRLAGKLGLALFLLCILLACKDSSPGQDIPAIKAEGASGKQLKMVENFVSPGYQKRNEGYDWVAVSISRLEDDHVKVKVRSRSDKKKPTCTFDAIAHVEDDSTFKANVQGKGIYLIRNNNRLSISPELPEDGGLLSFYCSGGASLAGDYDRIEGEIDTSQVDKTLFSEVLILQGIGFHVTSIIEDGRNTLTVAPFGLQIDNSAVTMDISGEVTDAEIEDLNSDGFPEVLIYTISEDSAHYGSVFGFTVNNGKSMSHIYFPPVQENESLNTGYGGHDEFAIVETSLVQRFPIMEVMGTNSFRSGKTRQISYKLKEGEAMRRFEVHKVIDY